LSGRLDVFRDALSRQKSSSGLEIDRRPKKERRTRAGAVHGNGDGNPGIKLYHLSREGQVRNPTKQCRKPLSFSKVNHQSERESRQHQRRANVRDKQERSDPQTSIIFSSRG
jgi:hypothetical protein